MEALVTDEAAPNKRSFQTCTKTAQKPPRAQRAAHGAQARHRRKTSSPALKSAPLLREASNGSMLAKKAKACKSAARLQCTSPVHWKRPPDTASATLASMASQEVDRVSQEVEKATRGQLRRDGEAEDASLAEEAVKRASDVEGSARELADAAARTSRSWKRLINCGWMWYSFVMLGGFAFFFFVMLSAYNLIPDVPPPD